MARFKSIKPEKRVEQEVRLWCCRNQIWTEVFDSKATYSEAKGHYARSKGLPTGTPDLLGISKEGLFVAIELKAPGKLEKVSLEQFQFLVRIIDHAGFAIVADSPALVETLWKEWSNLRNQSLEKASKFLMEQLPKRISHGGRLVPAPRS